MVPEVVRLAKVEQAVLELLTKVMLVAMLLGMWAVVRAVEVRLPLEVLLRQQKAVAMAGMALHLRLRVLL